MPVAAVFKTQQTPSSYESALLRHAQYVRWMKAIMCPCSDPITQQANPQCIYCKGRGKVYRAPESAKYLREDRRCDSEGRIYLRNSFIGIPRVYNATAEYSLSSVQPLNNEYIQLAEPFPASYDRLYVDYDISFLKSVTSENSEVYAANILRTLGTRLNYGSKTFDGTITQVTRVRNVTRGLLYTVLDFDKNFIYLSAMTDWVLDDVLEVDYKYVPPFRFLLHSVSEKMKWDSSFILPIADAVLVAPHYIKFSPDDVISAISMEQTSSQIIDPSLGTTDVLKNYFDLSKVITIYGSAGQYIDPVNVQIYKRNELKWLANRPTTKYSVQFTYHLAFSVLPSLPTLRSAENKEFVNRVNLIEYSKMTDKVII